MQTVYEMTIPGIYKLLPSMNEFIVHVAQIIEHISAMNESHLEPRTVMILKGDLIELPASSKRSICRCFYSFNNLERLD